MKINGVGTHKKREAKLDIVEVQIEDSLLVEFCTVCEKLGIDPEEMLYQCMLSTIKHSVIMEIAIEAYKASAAIDEKEEN